MRSFISLVPDVPGVICLLSTLPGKPIMDTSENGGSMAPGNAFMIVCAAMCASRKGVSGNQALQSSTRNRSKQQTEAEPNAVLTLANIPLAANDIFWFPCRSGE